MTSKVSMGMKMVKLILKSLLGIFFLVDFLIGLDSMTTGKFLIPSLRWAGWFITIFYLLVGIVIVIKSFLAYSREKKWLADYKKIS